MPTFPSIVKPIIASVWIRVNVFYSLSSTQHHLLLSTQLKKNGCGSFDLLLISSNNTLQLLILILFGSSNG